jgi:ABC-type antimicrobial peptide transport system permease subunit
MTATVRRAVGVTGLLPALRREVNELDPNLALYYVEMMEDRVARYTASDRFYLVLLGLFAALAMVLAMVGLYGVVAFLVSRRTREIGVRVALGAPPDHVVRLVVGQGIGPVLVGAALGLITALAGGRVLSSLLYQVETWDPLTFVGGTGLLLVVALSATLLPARWATKIPPTEAMRVE